MAGELDFFKKFLYEAPGEDPPDVAPDQGGDSPPPDMPEEDNSIDMSDPPDIPDDNSPGDPPPDLDSDVDTESEENYEDITGIDTSDQQSDEGLSDKISAIMNQYLYQKFLKLVGQVSSKISEIKDNSDVLYAVTKDCSDVTSRLMRLETCLKLYMTNQFSNNSYSDNLHFFNRCFNSYALIGKIFDDLIKSGIRSMKDT